MKYTWLEVLKIQDGKGEKVHLPEINECDANAKFILTEISIDDINSELLSTLKELKEFDCYEDYTAVENLIQAYKNNEDVPPIVIDKHGEIIEGYHRIPAQLELDRDIFKAFKQI